MMLKRSWIVFSFLLFLLACEQKPAQKKVFELLDSADTGISFANQLEYDEYLNAYTYRNFYNGAGVAVGDLNNDGLQDIYFAGNLVDNKLYLNKGNFQFEDITIKAGVAASEVWSTGVSMADVNGDGWLDIYVCKSGPLGGDNRRNSLYINNGDLTFTDKAADYGVDDLGLSNHAAFMDYDKDGDLDFYLLNNSTRSVGNYDLRKGQRNTPDPNGGNKLYRNDGGKFTDVTTEAGIYSSAIGYGLGVTVADVNVDGWPDIFVSNDFFERDYLYINQKNGTFSEQLEQTLTEISMGSMGADIADLNADGLPEIYVTEMLPATFDRIKTKSVFEDWDKYQSNIKSGYHHQFTRNTLQLNQGLIPGSEDQVFFSEVGRQTGLHATDWSWGALIFDYDNDGNKDLFVANGVGKDLTDHDYINFYGNDAQALEANKKDSTVITSMINAFPSVPLPNYLFKNKGDFEFEDVAASVGLDAPSFSNGAAYADLDNDGDIDLVVNNINDRSFVYRNRTIEDSPNQSLMIKLTGDDENPFAFGTRVVVYAQGKTQTMEHNPVKGYMSSMDYRMHFGLGASGSADSIDLHWPDNTFTRLRTAGATGMMSIEKSSVETTPKQRVQLPDVWFKETGLALDYSHKENAFSDFDRDRLLFQMASNEGPATAVADVNGDGLEDLFIGGAKGEEARLYLQKADGQFESLLAESIAADQLSEDVDAAFSDLDGDGDVDLLVASGGSEYGVGDPNLKDRIYFNDGNGFFTKATNTAFLPPANSSGFIRLIDYDGDGDQDIISGTRLIPFNYGVAGDLSVFENQGAGKFRNVSSNFPVFKSLGMLTDAAVADFDGDGDQDLVVVGEWSQVRLFINDQGRFEEMTQTKGLANTHGLWKQITLTDLNNDGLPDFVVGNMGLNSRLRASEDKPLTLHINDFDQNGRVEQITCMYEGEESYPILMLQDLVKQLPGLRKKYLKYNDYKDKTLDEIFSEAQLASMLTLKVEELASMVFINQGGAQFKKQPLPAEAQISQVFASYATDFNNDGIQDLILGGNQTRMKPELGINNALFGLTLKGLGDGTFTALKARESGIYVPGETRQILEMKVGNAELLAFVRNSDGLVVFEKNREK